MVDRSEHGVHRRVAGHHDLRLDGIGDLLFRASGASVLDVGSNRGMAGYEFACNGAKLIHGIDNYELGITVSREVFADIRNVVHRFEVVDLTGGEAAIKTAFGDSYGRYDIVLLLAVVHKLKRIMPPKEFRALMLGFGTRAIRYVGWRGYEEEIPYLDEVFRDAGLFRIHTSSISESITPAAIWRRPL